jgi:hypothetical protein
VDDIEPIETPASVVAGQAVAQGVAVGAGILVGGPFGAVLGAIATPVLELVIRRGNRRSAENVNRVLEDAAKDADMSADEMVDVIGRDDRYLAVSAAAVQAAMTTLDDAKVAALARVLGEALQDEARLDVSWLLIRALADLEAPHVRILRTMATELCPPVDSAVALRPGIWRLKALQGRLPQLEHGLDPIMATLERHGAVWGKGLAAAADDPVWSLTGFGRGCLRLLEERGRPDDSSSGSTSM